MNDLAAQIAQVKTGKPDAYAPIVRRFQDMAVGYGYAILGDLQLAEDAAQEAFIHAYFELPSLNDPHAFPGWFRRIVLKQIDRIRRRQRPSIPLDTVSHVASHQLSPVESMERQADNAALWSAIQTLPNAQREVVVLYYISEYSQQDVSEFLDIPVPTVKMRLYHARRALKQQLLALMQTALPNQRPSKDPRFTEKIMSFPVQVKPLPSQTVITSPAAWLSKTYKPTWTTR